MLKHVETIRWPCLAVNNEKKRAMLCGSGQKFARIARFFFRPGQSGDGKERVGWSNLRQKSVLLGKIEGPVWYEHVCIELYKLCLINLNLCWLGVSNVSKAIINHPYGFIYGLYFIPSIYAKFGDGLLFFLTLALYLSTNHNQPARKGHHRSKDSNVLVLFTMNAVVSASKESSGRAAQELVAVHIPAAWTNATINHPSVTTKGGHSKHHLIFCQMTANLINSSWGWLITGFISSITGYSWDYAHAYWYLALPYLPLCRAQPNLTLYCLILYYKRPRPRLTSWLPLETSLPYVREWIRT